MTISITKIDTDLEEFLKYDEDDGKGDTKTHIINPPSNTHLWKPEMTAQDVVDLARLTGREVVALCGYRWIPRKNPDKYPVCESCMKIATHLITEDE